MSYPSVAIILRSLCTYILWFFIYIFFGILCLPFVFLPRRFENRFLFFLMYAWNFLLLRVSGVRLSYRGLQNLPSYPGQPSILIMNHTSSLDIYLMEVLLKGYPHVWLSKAAYAKIPFFNILLRRMHIMVDRENARAAGKALVKMYKRVHDKKSHCVLFPEGKRFGDGKIHDFMPGFALLSQKLKRPVIPIYVDNMHNVHPKGQFSIATTEHVSVTVGKPMGQGEGETLDQFISRVKNWFLMQQEARGVRE